MTVATTAEDKMTTRRKPKPGVTVAEYLTQQINLSGKTQQEIAREVGFPKPNVISMIKNGNTKLPISKIAPMAKALGIDPVHLFRIVMQEYDPDTWAIIEESILKQPVISANEYEIIQVMRQGNVVNPKIRNDDDRSIILDAVSKLKPENF